MEWFLVVFVGLFLCGGGLVVVEDEFWSDVVGVVGVGVGVV